MGKKIAQGATLEGAAVAPEPVPPFPGRDPPLSLHVPHLLLPLAQLGELQL